MVVAEAKDALTERTEEIASFFKAVSDPTRLLLLALLSQGELCVCHFMELTDLPQSTISRHLGHLKRARLVKSRREGTWIYYSLHRPRDHICLAQLKSLTKELSRDVAVVRALANLKVKPSCS